MKNRVVPSLWLIAPTFLMMFVSTSRLPAQGPLTPPGPPAPTMKTLDQIEPGIPVNSLPGGPNIKHIIDDSGRYYLTGDIASSDSITIEIRASDVLIDLKGFSIRGNGSTTTTGLRVNPERTNVTILNGGIFNFTYFAIDLLDCPGSRLEKIVGGACGQTGIRIGDFTTVTDCRSSNNLVHGFLAAAGCTFVRCTSTENGIDGFFCNTNAVFDDCVATSNSAQGIETAGGSVVTGCITRTNGGSGIKVAEDCSVKNSTAFMNGGNGIQSGDGGAISDCTAANNVALGIFVVNAVISNCTARANGTDGIRAPEGSSIQGCTADENAGDGIEVGSGCTVLNCVVRLNGLDSNGSGIHLTSGENRIEGNNLTSNYYGIDADGVVNFIVRNTARGNTDSFNQITAGNSVGTVVSISGSPVTTTNPWANFVF